MRIPFFDTIPKNLYSRFSDLQELNAYINANSLSHQILCDAYMEGLNHAYDGTPLNSNISQYLYQFMAQENMAINHILNFFNEKFIPKNELIEQYLRDAFGIFYDKKIEDKLMKKVQMQGVLRVQIQTIIGTSLDISINLIRPIQEIKEDIQGIQNFIEENYFFIAEEPIIS